MVSEQLKNSFLSVLKRELVPALGCTEPIAIAYAAAKARSVLGCFPEKIEICCSGNIIKNVKGVTVPNSHGLKGVGVAAVLGVVGGDADRMLQVLEGVTEEQIEYTKQLLRSDYFSCKLQENVENLYITATVWNNGDHAQVTIIDRHTLITDIIRNGEVLYHNDPVEENIKVDWDLWNVKAIVDYASTVDIEDVKDILDQQIEMNSAISREGLAHAYGARVGYTLLDLYGDDVRTRARAKAAAASDARMGGSSMPVVINSGSGNQGITVSLPVIEYAREKNASGEQLYRALVISNLIAIYQKHFIGSLSAFCGAVTAACGAGAAITYLYGGDQDAISRTITNTVANVGGIICDGAKSSCAAKIASAVDAAILAHELSMKDCVFKPGEGIVQESVEDTIKNIGRIGRVGMKSTDVEVLHIMMKTV